MLCLTFKEVSWVVFFNFKLFYQIRKLCNLLLIIPLTAIFSKKLFSDFFFIEEFFHWDIGVYLLKYVNMIGEYDSMIFNWEKTLHKL